MRAAVVRNIEIIGEATKRLPEDLRDREPGIPWKSIAGMRDVVVHDWSRARPEPVTLPAVRSFAMLLKRGCFPTPAPSASS
jgi:uncharacterized protein with HEPN domain